MTVGTYLNNIMQGNDPVAPSVLRYRAVLRENLTNPERGNQIRFALDVIEVSDGWAFQISIRRFFQYRQEDFQGRSARAFVVYDCTTPPEPGQFAETVINSFQAHHERINVLNKIYQCLMAKRVPAPIKKLVLAGPQDSGMDTWLSIFRRIITNDNIVTLTRQGRFSAAGVMEDTELIVVREASRMNAQQAEQVLRGGVELNVNREPWAEFGCNFSPFFMTSTYPPNLGPDDARNVTVYRTRPFPNIQLDTLDAWMYDHAMDCIAWIAEEINRNLEVVENEERWYEDLTGINLIKVKLLELIFPLQCNAFPSPTSQLDCRTNHILALDIIFRYR